MLASVINLEAASGSSVTQKITYFLVLLYCSPITFQALVKIYMNKCTKGLTEELGIENNSHEWFLPWLLYLPCSHSTFLLATDWNQDPVQYLLYASWNLHFFCFVLSFFKYPNFFYFHIGQMWRISLRCVLTKYRSKLGDFGSLFCISSISEEGNCGKDVKSYERLYILLW